LIRTTTVGVADCAISKDPDETLATYALGSCVAIVMHDPVAKVGGMLHLLLPECSLDSVRGRANPFVYADTGIPELLDRILHLGAQTRRVMVRAAGGASVLNDNGFFDIGRRNHVSVRKALWKAGLLIYAECIGGEVSRSVRLDIGTGNVWVKIGGEPERELAPSSARIRKAG
jgi:chemotaxis protein CheD